VRQRNNNTRLPGILTELWHENQQQQHKQVYKSKDITGMGFNNCKTLSMYNKKQAEHFEREPWFRPLIHMILYGRCKQKKLS